MQEYAQDAIIIGKIQFLWNGRLLTAYHTSVIPEPSETEHSWLRPATRHNGEFHEIYINCLGCLFHGQR